MNNIYTHQGKTVFLKDYFKAIPGSDSLPVFPCSANVVEIPYKHNVIEIPFSPHVANLNYDCESSAAIDICLLDDSAWLSTINLADISDFDDAMVTPFNAGSFIDHFTELLRKGNEEDEFTFMRASQGYTLYLIKIGRCLTILKKLVKKFMPDMTWAEFFHKRFNGIISDRDDNRYRSVARIKKVEDWSHLGIARLGRLAGIVCGPKYSASENPIADFNNKHRVYNDVAHWDKVDQEKNDKEALNRALFFEIVEGHVINMAPLDTDLLEDVCHFIPVDHTREPKHVNKISKELKRIIKDGRNPNDYLYELCSNVGASSSDASPKHKAPKSLRCIFELFYNALEKAFADDRYRKDVLLEMIDYAIGRLLKFKEKCFGCKL